MDIVATKIGGKTHLLLNEHPYAAGLSVRIRGKGSNPFGVGCQLQMLDDAGGLLFTRSMPGGGSGWQSQNDPLLILPMLPVGTQYRILWPGGAKSLHAVEQSTASMVITE